MAMKEIMERLNDEWVVVEATGSFAELNLGTSYSFELPDIINVKKSIFLTKSKVVFADHERIKAQMEGMQNLSEFEFELHGEKLILKPLNSGQVLTLIRKN